jgi:hypothetical protein
MTVFFQQYSVLQTLLVFRQIASAKKIVFYHQSPTGEQLSAGWMRTLVVWLIRRINSGVAIHEIDQEGLYQLGFYANNLESDRYVDEVFSRCRRSASYGVMQDVINDVHVENFYKMRLLDIVINRTCFLRAIPQVLGVNQDGVVIPDSIDPDGLCRHFVSDDQFRRAIPIQVRMLHRFLQGWGKIKTLRYLMYLVVFVPMRYLVLLVFQRGMTWHPAPLCADVVVPLIAGFSEKGLVRGRRRHDDSHLLDRELGPERVAFYFSDWAFSREEEDTQRKVMEGLGIRHFDPRTFRPSIGYIREAGRRCRAVWEGVSRRPQIIWDDPAFVYSSAALLHHHLNQLLFMHSVDFKVAVEFGDYSPVHVVRTMAANQHGRLTVGMHHNAPEGPKGFPILRYAYLNKYCTWGDELKKLYAPYWDGLQTIPVGALRVDFVAEAQREERQRELDQLYSRRYGGQHPLIVLLFPSFSKLNVMKRINAMIDGVRKLGDLPGNFQVVCRFRSVSDLDRFRTMGLDSIMASDRRIVVDMTDLTTYEWIALSDVVIVSGVSSGMVEAAAAGKPCFTFDYVMLAESVYGRYGTDLVLKTAEDLVRVVKHAEIGFGGWDCRWNQIVKDYSYAVDGQSMDRYRAVIEDAVAAVEGGERTNNTRVELAHVAR